MKTNVHPLCVACPQLPAGRSICDRIDSCVVDFYMMQMPEGETYVKIPTIEIIRVAGFKREELKAKGAYKYV